MLPSQYIIFTFTQHISNVVSSFLCNSLGFILKQLLFDGCWTFLVETLQGKRTCHVLWDSVLMPNSAIQHFCRRSGQRSRVRKLQYIAELERTVDSLQVIMSIFYFILLLWWGFIVLILWEWCHFILSRTLELIWLSECHHFSSFIMLYQWKTSNWGCRFPVFSMQNWLRMVCLRNLVLFF